MDLCCRDLAVLLGGGVYGFRNGGGGAHLAAGDGVIRLAVQVVRNALIANPVFPVADGVGCVVEHLGRDDALAAAHGLVDLHIG